MNIFRGIITSILIFVFMLAALVTIVGVSLERAIVPQTTAMIIDQAKMGERLAAVLPEVIKQDLPKPYDALISIDDVKRFVAEALPAKEIDAMLKPLAGEVVGYIRGDADIISKVDMAPTIARADAAAKKIVPGKMGVQLAAVVQAQFKSAGLDKGLEIPRQQLDAARTFFSQFHLGAQIAPVLVLLLFLLIAAVAPHGLRGRLHWCATALIVVGCLSAGAALCALILPSLIAGLPLGGDTPPEIRSLIKDAIATLGGVLARDIFIAAAAGVGGGAVLIVIGLILRKRGSDEGSVQEFSTLPKH